MTKNYNAVRFFLFSHSYCGEKIASYLIKKYKGKKLEGCIQKLSLVFGFKLKQVNNFVLFDIKTDSPYLRLPKKLKMYLEIENELAKLSEEKLDKYSTALEDYQRQMFYPAIERAIGNFLEEVEDDKKFQELMESRFKSTCYIYYKVVCKYKLPTLRTIPFVLRLIT